MTTTLASHTRRSLLIALATLAGGGCASLSRPHATSQLAAIEHASGGRLGVFALDTLTGKTLGHRANERFGMCSTSKLPLAAMVLQAGDAGSLNIDTPIPITKADLVSHAPVTGPLAGNGSMTARELARVTQLTSDNPAANLLLARLGGPQGFTNKLREWGDNITRLDRIEPEMNAVPVGEVRDTTTPEAMARTVAHIFKPGTLTNASRTQLIQWMVETKTGSKRIRAGLPKDWPAGDKTGTGIWKQMVNKHNDVAAFWPIGAAPRDDVAPVVLAVYFDARAYFDDVRPEDDAVHADVARVVAAWVTA